MFKIDNCPWLVALLPTRLYIVESRMYSTCFKINKCRESGLILFKASAGNLVILVWYMYTYFVFSFNKKRSIPTMILVYCYHSRFQKKKKNYCYHIRYYLCYVILGNKTKTFGSLKTEVTTNKSQVVWTWKLQNREMIFSQR